VKKVKIHRSKARRTDRPRGPAAGLGVPNIAGSGTSAPESDSATTTRRP
jgi:hypothetical protein